MAVKTNKVWLIDISNRCDRYCRWWRSNSNYGVVEWLQRTLLRDGAYTILNENYRGVIKTNDNQIVVDVYIIVGYGLKFREVSHNVQDSVK